MELSRERKVFLVVAVVAGAAFVIDRGVLGGAEASAAPVIELPTVSGGLAPEPGADSAQQGGLERSAASIARRIREIVIDKGVEGDEAGDAFRYPESWAATPRGVAAAGGPDGTTVAAPAFTLSAAMPTQRGGVAVINGRTYRTGDRVGAYTLVSVTDRTALLRGPAGEISLSVVR